MNRGDGTVTIREPGAKDRTIFTSYKTLPCRSEYTHFTIGLGQSVKVSGDATVLFYRQQQSIPISGPDLRPNQPLASQLLPRTSAESQDRLPLLNCEPITTAASTTPAPQSLSSTPEIMFRLQTSALGHFSTPYPKSVLRPKITTGEFFAWFALQTSHCLPHGPEKLRFTFKDAMPVPKSSEILKGSEEDLMFMRQEIKTECEKAGKWIGGLKEFGVLVSVPGWGEEVGSGKEEEDEW